MTKLAAEYYLYYYHQVHGLDYAALRYSNVYGPRQDPHGEAGVVAVFSNRIRSGDGLTIFGDGEQTRDYVYVGDVVAANLALSEGPLERAALVDDRAFNVATGRETTVNTLARLLMEAAGREVPVQYAPERPGELRNSSLDAGRLRQRGWAPRVSLAEGLKQTYEYIAGGGNGR